MREDLRKEARVKKSALKLTIAFVAIGGLSAPIVIFDVPVAAAVCLVGYIGIIEHYLDRCCFCGSWRMKIEENWYPAELPGWNEVTRSRICKHKQCGREEVDHLFLPDPNPLHF